MLLSAGLGSCDICFHEEMCLLKNTRPYLIRNVIWLYQVLVIALPCFRATRWDHLGRPHSVSGATTWAWGLQIWGFGLKSSRLSDYIAMISSIFIKNCTLPPACLEGEVPIPTELWLVFLYLHHKRDLTDLLSPATWPSKYRTAPPPPAMPPVVYQHPLFLPSLPQCLHPPSTPFSTLLIPFPVGYYVELNHVFAIFLE